MDIDLDRLRDALLSPGDLPAAKRPGGVVLALPGDGACSHRIPVRVEMNGRDGPVIRGAQRAGKRYALLDRMCPLCRTRRRFRLSLIGPYARPGTPESAPLSPYHGALKGYVPLGLSDPFVRSERPPEIAVRWYREAMEHRQRDEWSEAERKLRDCIALFDELHMIGESLTAEAELNAVRAEATRVEGASAASTMTAATEQAVAQP